MKNVTLDELLSVMSKEKFNELKNRGQLVITKRAPNTEISYDSIPLRYRRKLVLVSKNK